MILFTGFSPYGERSENPSMAAAQAMEAHPALADHTVRASGMPVAIEGLTDRVQDLLNRHSPDLIISVGLWPGETCLRLEKCGLNYANFEIPDNDDALLSDTQLISNQPDALFSNAPILGIQKALLENGIPARISLSAGSYLCNALAYTALNLIREQDLATRFLFVHIPYSPRQVAELINQNSELGLELHQRGDLASMSLEMVTSALGIIANVMAKELTIND